MWQRDEWGNHRRYVRDGVIRSMYEERLDQLNQQLVDAMGPELDLMTQWGLIGEVTGMEVSMQRLNISSDLVFLTKLSGGNNCFKVLLDNQATLHVFKNVVLVPNIRPN